MTKPWGTYYKIVPGSSGSLLCPPGHPALSWSLEGYESTRHRNPFSIGAIDNALADDFDGSDAIKARVRKIFDEAELVPSEMWIRSVYAYFRNSYAPENLDRNVSKAITHSRAEIAAAAARKALAEHFSVLPINVGAGEGVHNAESYRDGSAKMMRGARRGWEVTAKADGSEVFVYALTDDGTRYGSLPILERYMEALEDNGFADARIEPVRNEGGVFIPERVRATNPAPVERIDPNRHLAVLCIRKYFPDHEPRLDLIDHAPAKARAGKCTRCGERVQYEAKFDKFAKVTTRMDGTGMTHWTYGTDCPKGGDHTTE